MLRPSSDHCGSPIPPKPPRPRRAESAGSDAVVRHFASSASRRRRSYRGRPTARPVFIVALVGADEGIRAAIGRRGHHRHRARQVRELLDAAGEAVPFDFHIDLHCDLGIARRLVAVRRGRDASSLPTRPGLRYRRRGRRDSWRCASRAMLKAGPLCGSATPSPARPRRRASRSVLPSGVHFAPLRSQKLIATSIARSVAAVERLHDRRAMRSSLSSFE